MNVRHPNTLCREVMT